MKKNAKWLMVFGTAVAFLYRREILHTLSPIMLDAIIRGQTLPSLTQALRQSNTSLQNSLAQRPDTTWNRRILSHIIGIEKWGQHRLHVALGQPLVMDEYDTHRPSKATDWNTLKQQLAATRQETIHLAEQLAQPHVNQSMVIPHNQFGDLSLRGWLYYLRVHADAEIQKMQR